MTKPEQTDLGETLEAALADQTFKAIRDLADRRRSVRMEVLSRVREELEAREPASMPDLTVADRIIRGGRAQTVEDGLLNDITSLCLALEHLHLVRGAGALNEQAGEQDVPIQPPATAEALT